MSAARRGGGGGPANAAARGGILIVVAVIIGALLLSRGFSEEGGLVATADGGSTDTTAPETTDDTSGDTTDDTSGDTTGDTATDTTEAVPEVRPPEEVRFVVLNGSGVNQAAAGVSTELSSFNYVPGGTGNVPTGQTEASTIYFAEGWQAEAEKMAADLGVGVEVTAPLPAPFEYDMGDATILVVLGTDEVISP